MGLPRLDFKQGQAALVRIHEDDPGHAFSHSSSWSWVVLVADKAPSVSLRRRQTLPKIRQTLSKIRLSLLKIPARPVKNPVKNPAKNPVENPFASFLAMLREK
jgi:hypothetical protein